MKKDDFMLYHGVLAGSETEWDLITGNIPQMAQECHIIGHKAQIAWRPHTVDRPQNNLETSYSGQRLIKSSENSHKETDNLLFHRFHSLVTDSYKHLRDFTPQDTKIPQGPTHTGTQTPNSSCTSYHRHRPQNSSETSPPGIYIKNWGTDHKYIDFQTIQRPRQKVKVGHMY